MARTEFVDASKLLVFSSELDPAGLADADAKAAELRAIRATTYMKLSLVLGDRVPVLAQNQVFDSPLLFGLMASPTTSVKSTRNSSKKELRRERRRTEWHDGEERTKESDALIWLIENEYVQVRIHEHGLDETPKAEDRFTLRNACASALRKPGFVLSGWPELPKDARDDIAQILTGQSKAQPPPEWISRVNAIERIDEALRGSGSSGRARTITMSLDKFIQAELEQRRGPRPGRYLEGWFTELRSFAKEVEAVGGLELHGKRITAFNLNSRSDWRCLIEAFKQEHPERVSAGHRPLVAASAMVDLAYNRKVALSLGAPVQREVAQEETEQDLITEDPDVISVNREAVFLGQRTNAEWLSWAFVKAHLENGLVPNEVSKDRVAMRNEIKESLLTQKVAAEVDGGFVLGARVWLPYARGGGIGMAAIGGAMGGVFTPSAPLIGAGIGAAVGAVGAHYIGLLDPIPQLRDWRIDRGVKALSAELKTYDNADA